MKNPEIEEGAELPAAVVFVVLAGLKDCTDGPMIPNALRALNYALRGVDSGVFVLSTIAGVIVIIPDTASWTVDRTFDALSNAKTGFALRVGVSHGLVDAVTDTDDEPNLIGPPINTAARLATSTDNPGTLIHETYARFVDGTLPATHWLHRSKRKEIHIAGKPQDPPFVCFVSPNRFDTQALEELQQPQWRAAALVAYDLPKFSGGDRAQLRQRFTRLAHVFRRLRQQPPKLAAAAQLSPGGDGGVLVLEGLANAAAFAARLRELAEIESLDHAEAIAVKTRIGVHYGQVTDYVNARGITRPTGRDLFIADEIAGDSHARDHSGIVVTRQLADSLAGGSTTRLTAEFEPLPPLTSGPAAELERFVQRTAARPA
jgi:class 3 adenylate cyclase